MMYDLRFKNNVKQIVAVGSLVAILLVQETQIVSVAYAQNVQQASDSAVQDVLGISQTSIDSSNPFADSEFFTSQNTSTVGTSSLLQQALGSLQNQTSATVQQPTSILPLPKHTYKKDEQVSLTVSNAKAQDITVDVLDRSGQSVEDAVTAEKITNDNTTQVVLQPVEYKFKPGKYTIKITDNTGHTFTQDFTWGVLAINTDKSIYLPGETADLQMAVLDETGNMVCDADVTLRITDPTGQTTVLKTADGSITVTPQCLSHDVTTIPDYYATYITSGTGNYTMSLAATTKNGTDTIDDGFVVQDSVSFDITRTAQTRIYPPNTYPVILTVKAQEDFDGTIQDYVPSGFTISQASESAVPFTQNQSSQNFTTSSGLKPGSLLIPFNGPIKVTQGFGDQLTDPQEKKLYAQFGLKGHDGVDFDMRKGTSVLAADGGKVVLAENSAYGLTIVIQHAWGKSYYGHLDKVLVRVGQQVTKGEEIALSGNSGLSTAPHLHFGIKLNNYDVTNGYYGKIDPSAYFAKSIATTTLGLTTNKLQSDVKIISWNVSLKKGQTIKLAYAFQAPMVSPEFYDLGPAQVFDSNGFLFREARQWQIASDATNTYYMTSTAGSSPYPTTSWTYATAANASSNVTSFAENKKTAGLYQFQPGATNTTSLGSTASSLPSTVTNTGWIYTGTNLDGLQTDAGTWTINYKYSVVYSTAPTTKNLWYRVLKVTCSAGSCTSGAVISPTDASAPASSGWSKTAIGTLPATGVLSGAQSLTFSGALTRFSSGDKLYVEFAIETNSTNNNSGGWKIEANTSSDNIVTSNVSTPPPVINQVHYRWRNDDGSETAATWRTSEDNASNKAQNTNVRLRVEISNSTGGSSATSVTYRVEYGTLSTTCSAISSWTAVPATATTEAFQMGSSSFVSDATATTNVASGLTDVGSNFVAGQVKTTSDQTAGITLATTDFTEIEYSMQATNNSSVGTTYCFRLTNAGSTTNFSYSQYPQLTVGQPTMDQKHYRLRNDDGTEGTTTGNILYFSPISDIAAAVFAPTGCTSHYDCLNDYASNAASSTTAPTNDGGTTTLQTALGFERYGLNLGSLPSGYTITGMTVNAYISDTGNPNTNVTLGYCLSVCDGTDDALAASAHNIGTSAYTLYSDTFSGLSLTNGVGGLVIQADSAKAAISTLYVQITYSAPGATWKAAQDTAVTNQTQNQNIRVRIEVANTGAIFGSRNFKLQYASKNGTCAVSSFADVPITATTEPFEMVASSYFANHDATTTQLTATGSFTAGEMIEDPSNTTNSITLNGSTYTEVEYDLLVTTNAVGNYCFQLVDSSLGALDNYSTYPELYIPPVPKLDQLLRHGEWFYNGAVQPFTF